MPEEQRDEHGERSERETALGDQVYQPDGSEVQDDAGVLEPEDTLIDRGVSPAIDEGYSPPERPLAVDRSGTTAAEQRERESLDERLRAEEPDVGVPPGNDIGDQPGGDGEPVDYETAGEQRAGRLVGSDRGVPQGARGGGKANDTTAYDAGIAGGAASAEEAAVHITEPPPDETGENSETEENGETDEKRETEETQDGA